MNGIIDRETNSWPGFNNVFKTCTYYKVAPNQRDLIFNNFDLIHNQFLKVGRLTDEFLVDTGFMKDLNFKGVEISRILTYILYMRSMCISHVYQRDIRLSVSHGLIE